VLYSNVDKILNQITVGNRCNPSQSSWFIF